MHFKIHYMLFFFFLIIAHLEHETMGVHYIVIHFEPVVGVMIWC